MDGDTEAEREALFGEQLDAVWRDPDILALVDTAHLDKDDVRKVVEEHKVQIFGEVAARYKALDEIRARHKAARRQWADYRTPTVIKVLSVMGGLAVVPAAWGLWSLRHPEVIIFSLLLLTPASMWVEGRLTKRRELGLRTLERGLAASRRRVSDALGRSNTRGSQRGHRLVGYGVHRAARRRRTHRARPARPGGVDRCRG